MGVLVIVAYKPKPGKADDLLHLTREHVPILKSQGFVTDRIPTAMRAADGTIVEVFEWVSNEAIAKAHDNPVVLQMWTRYGECCDFVKLVDLAESQDMFASFEPIDI